MKNGQLQHLNPWQKVALFFLTLFLGITFSSVVNQLLGSFLLNSEQPFEVMNDLTRIDSIRMLKIGNLIVHLIAFIAPAVILAKLFNFEPREAVLFKRPVKRFWIWLPVLFILLTLVNEGLYVINHQIDFSFLSNSVQETFEYQQAVQEKTIFAYIGGTWKSYFVNLILICLVPAISEELLFRGVLQNLFSKVSQNIWVGISISAFLFALIHLQPFNFLPMFALAFCYGIIAAYTGSLWITMILHFLNNALTLSFAHFEIMFGWKDLEISPYMSFGLILTCIGLLYVLNKKGLASSQWTTTKGVYYR